MNKKLLLRCAALALIVFASTHVAHAAVFNIPNSDIAALKNAIVTANGNGQADTINLAAVGTYTLTAIDNSMNGANGLPVIISDVAGLDLTINGNGATIQRSTAPGTPEFRILQTGIGATVSGNGLTIANGKVSGSFPAQAGAGILNSGATLALTDCVLRENAGGLGGGLYNDAGLVTLNTCTLDLNTATDSGAGIANDGQLTLLDSRLTNNSTFAPSGRAGAGILNLGTTTLQRCLVKANKARAAGGGIQNYGTLTVESSSLEGNQTLAEGGAISTYPNAAHSSAMTLLNSAFINNSATYGGGISNIGATLILRNSTVRGNSATHAGGLYNSGGGNSTVQCNTFSANSAPDAGGIYNLNTGAPTTLLIRNTILQTGSSGVNLLNDNGVVTSEGHNLSNDGAGATGTGPGGLLNGPGDIRNTNPNLGPLQNNGGPTLTHALLSPSPAIDAGDDAVLDLPLGLTSDQRGSGFPRWKGLHVDIGAVESGLSLIVTTIDDHNDGTCTQSDCTLREAITAINMAGGGTISFTPGLTGTIQLGAELPTVSANLLLQGPGANLLTVRRNSAGNYRIFTISNGTVDGPDVLITGLTISNGQAPAVAFPNSSGGGVLNDRGWLWIDRCTLSGNSSFLPADTYGGGIFNNEGDLIVTESTVTGNNSHFGGGIASSKTVAGASHVQIVSSTISGNTSDGGNGGGIYCQAINAGATSDASLTNCTLSGNSAPPSFTGGAGGAIFNFGSLSGTARFSLDDCTLSGNNAPAAGGIYNNSFSATTMVTVRNTVLKTGASGENFINSSGTITSLGHNVCNDAAGGLSGTGPGGYLTGAGDMRQTDPLLGPLQNNGGRTFTHALLNGSPAINAGDNNGSDPNDQRGAPRVGTNDIGAFEFGSVAPAPAVVSAVSRKLHGGTPFDIDLPFVGEVGIECRSGGANSDYQVVLNFANAVTYTGASVSFGAGSVSSSTGSGTNGITVNLTGMTSGQTSTITLGGVSDGVDTGDVSLLMAVLIGDTNGSGVVNSGDTLQTRSRSGQATDATNFRSDVNTDGFVNSGDTTAVRARSGTALPP